jgi:hypothetical protein
MAEIGSCALCGLERTLLESHIFPEFPYDELYDGLHSYRVRSTAPNSPSPRRRKGIYERLLCADCDQRRLGRLDDYAARVFKGGVGEVTDKPGCLIVSNLNYTTFKLWQMSLLWRCGASRRPEFALTRLGPHAEKLRRFLLEERAGQPHEYGCTVFLPSSHEVTKQFIYPPEPVTIDGHRCYRTLFGALWWVFVVSSHSAAFPFQEGFLDESGVLSIFKEATHSSNFILKLGKELGAIGQVEDETGADFPDRSSQLDE